MSAVSHDIPPLVAGDFLSRAEFLRRWEAMPHLKRAELIQGVVYMPSPLSRQHGSMDIEVAGWIYTYKAHTPGCETLATHYMGEEDVTQPDSALRIKPEFGGQSQNVTTYVAGGPEFLSETCVSSASYDLHQKLEIYQEAGVREYLAILLHEQEVRWHELQAGKFVVLPPPRDGIYRSPVFPGLWLDAAALLAGDSAKVLAVLNDGLRTPEHQAFVAELGQRAGKT